MLLPCTPKNCINFQLGHLAYSRIGVCMANSMLRLGTSCVIPPVWILYFLLLKLKGLKTNLAKGKAETKLNNFSEGRWGERRSILLC